MTDRVLASESAHLAVKELIVAAMAAVAHYDAVREVEGDMPEIPVVERLRRAIGDLEAAVGVGSGVA